MNNVLPMGLLMILLTCVSGLGADSISVTIDMSSVRSGKVVANKFSDINMWMVENTWLKTADGYPQDYFKTNFPFVERIQLMAATGGNEQRDLFKNPKDRTTLTDYDFHKLLHGSARL